MRTDMELWAEIRRRVLTGELSKCGACKVYDLGWWTLKKILEHAEPPKYQLSKAKPRPKIVVAGRIGIADDIKPVPSPALAILRRVKQPLDDLRPSLWTVIGFEFSDVTGRWRQPDQIKRQPAKSSRLVGIVSRVDARGLHVAGMPTRTASSITSAEPLEQDAAVVRRLREAGAIILGKTVTTEFACFDPSPTRNPSRVNRQGH